MRGTELKSLTFLLFHGRLPGFERSVILGQVHKIDIRPIPDGFEQAEESRCGVACKEGLQAIEHHSLVTVTQLRIKSKRKRKSATAHSVVSASQETPISKDISHRCSHCISSNKPQSFPALCQLVASTASPRIPARSPGLLHQHTQISPSPNCTSLSLCSSDVSFAPTPGYLQPFREDGHQRVLGQHAAHEAHLARRAAPDAQPARRRNAGKGRGEMTAGRALQR